MKNVLILAPFQTEEIDYLKEKWKGQYVFLEETSGMKRKDLLLEANIIVGEPDVEEILQLPKLEWIQMTWAGTDKYTFNPKFPHNLLLTNASGAFGDTMAEYAIGEILLGMRHFSYYEENQRKGIWKGYEGNDGTLVGKNVLILGAGDIGSKCAKRLQAFGCKTIGVRRKVSLPVDGFERLISLQQVDEVIGEVDILIGCIPNSEMTRGFLHKERLLKMKKNSILLNMGRGNLIVSEDLLEVLEMGWFQRVILDVTSPEPLPENHPLWQQERVRITPHIAGPSFGKNHATEKLLCQIVDENLGRYAEGKALRNCIIWEQ